MTKCLKALNRFYAHLEKYSPQEQKLVTDALFFAFNAHGLTLRKSNDELYFAHPLAAAHYLATFKLDAPTLSAALLHDVAEDTTISISQIIEEFGGDVGKLVEGVTRLQATGKQVTSQAQRDQILVDSTNRLFQFMLEDVRVVLVKLADRRHNMHTIHALTREKQEAKAHEVLQVYAPLAYRLGMWDVKSELEELALKTLHPLLYRRFKDLMDRRKNEQNIWLEYILKTITEQLEKAGIAAMLEPSPEQVYTIFQDYKREGHLPARLPDTIRIAVLVKERCNCYEALCAVHELWSPIPGTFDDYIAQPRENLYQALHTTVFGPGGRLLKVRFRTFQMHQIAHHGILARWSENLSEQAGSFEALQRLMKRLQPVQGIAERDERLTAYREALTDQIQVFTPEGELIELPSGSTSLDFAYQIHSKLGDEAVGVSINDIRQPLNKRLKSGDQVTIERKPGRMPKREWLDEDLGFVNTVYARNRIRRVFRRIEEDKAVNYGLEAIKQEFAMMGLSDLNNLDSIAKELSLPSSKELLIAIARAEIMPNRVAHIAMQPIWDKMEKIPIGGDMVSPDGIVRVSGIPGRPVKLCGRCKPVAGDPIVGNLLRGGQVTIHRLDCHHITNASRSNVGLNLVEVSWIKEPLLKRDIHIRVAALDRSGLAFSISKVFDLEQINISEMYVRVDRDHNVALLSVTAEMTNLRQLSRVLHRIAQIPAIKAVQRVSSPSHFQDDALLWAIENI
ncbi:MAG: bifunctional (p)ppGpp synthetase/guanosine-3',5'-bis(diphosphate) 3'-pyrophosphohydrolase [Anaerolineales bacterium]|nr:bifunctional (p)ppGpp synthetase/guanosine-3',5'-bis(diphosphate) 3'-pyrophosphohydrolase [Anaerolineales bacterium]